MADKAVALPSISEVLKELRAQLLATRVSSEMHPIRLEVVEANVDVDVVVERNTQGSIVLGVLGGSSGVTRAKGSTISVHMTLKVIDRHGAPLQIAEEWTPERREGTGAS